MQAPMQSKESYKRDVLNSAKLIMGCPAKPGIEI